MSSRPFAASGSNVMGRCRPVCGWMRPVRHGCQEGSAKRGTAKACGMPSSVAGMRRGWRGGSGAVECAAGFIKLSGVRAGDLTDVLFEAEQALDGLVLALGAGGVQAAALAQHGLLHLFGDDGADLAQVFAD